ncbi:MAG TPA: tetratricopeptide repeat protein [Thermoanaerobaculia bacterium]|nr:tetratricopeptide repeat protein [Thermoanaerobaculia bacterium]
MPTADRLEGRWSAGVRVAATEAARRRIARQIHDDFSQRLAGLALALRSVRKELPEEHPCRIELDTLSGRMAELGKDLRHLSHDLHPAALERRGLAEALRDHCSEVEARHGLPVELDLPSGERPIPPETALGLFRITQEALANVVRHAGARRARVSLTVLAGSARVIVSDDGAGFDARIPGRAGGLGLATIEERAGLLGGTCRIASQPGAGTEVEVTVPLPVQGGPGSLLGLVLRRHRGLVAALAAIVLALAGGLAATLLQARRTAQEARRAERTVQFLEGLFRTSDPRQARGQTPDARELLRRGAERLQTELADEPLLEARLADTLGELHTRLGLFDEAKPLLERALEVRQRLLGRQHAEVADTLDQLGSLAHLSGRGDAVTFFSQALAIVETRNGPEHPEVAELLNRLGASLAAKGRFDQAEATLQRCLLLQERLFGGHDPRVAKTLHNLSGIAYYRQRIEEAERLLERALEIREAALPADDLELAGSREALALLRLEQDRPLEAIRLLEPLAATFEKVYGSNHPEVAKTLLNLGLAHSDLGHRETARQLFERAAAICERTLEPDHPMRVRAVAALEQSSAHR